MLSSRDASGGLEGIPGALAQPPGRASLSTSFSCSAATGAQKLAIERHMKASCDRTPLGSALEPQDNVPVTCPKFRPTSKTEMTKAQRLGKIAPVAEAEYRCPWVR